MNFFRKKNTTYITLEPPDFNVATQKLWSDLVFTIEGHQVSQVTLRLYEAADISLKTLSVVISLGLKLQSESVAMDLEAPQRIAHIIRKLNLASAFTRITEVA